LPVFLNHHSTLGRWKRITSAARAGMKELPALS
jgi:hypothetical protein